MGGQRQKETEKKEGGRKLEDICVYVYNYIRFHNEHFKQNKKGKEEIWATHGSNKLSFV